MICRYLLGLFILSGYSSFGQVTLAKSVMSSSGGSFAAGSTTITYTLGETFASSHVSVTEGFQGLPLILVTSIEDEKSSIQFYPNPFTSTIIIKGAKNADNVSIYSMIGTEIPKLQNRIENDIEITLENISTGYYLMKVGSKSFLIQKL